MHCDTIRAREVLDRGDFTCAVCRDDACYTTNLRGVKPLLQWLEGDISLSGFCAADKVVGRAAAFLYCLLGVREVYARVMSKPAAQVLENHGIAVFADSLPDGIINRAGTGPCPFEAAVMDITDPQEALQTIRRKLASM